MSACQVTSLSCICKCVEVCQGFIYSRCNCDFRQQFLNFSQDTIFGAATEQSWWYEKQVWEHHEKDLGRGFNGGVVFWNLARARSLGWANFWWQETQKAMQELGWDYLALGDQDILNLLVHVDKNRVHALPCAFNVQMFNPERGAVCLNRSASCLILHGNAGSFHKGGIPGQKLYALFTETNPSQTVCQDRGNVSHLVHELALLLMKF